MVILRQSGDASLVYARTTRSCLTTADELIDEEEKSRARQEAVVQQIEPSASAMVRPDGRINRF
jgi:hypothetical protein